MVQLGYNMMKGAEYWLSVKTSVTLTEEHNVMINSEQLIGTTEYLMLWSRHCINHNWLRLHSIFTLKHVPGSLFQVVQGMQTLHMMMRISVGSQVDQNHFHMPCSHYQVPVMVENYFNDRLM
jgi:hypothetical protein